MSRVNSAGPRTFAPVKTMTSDELSAKLDFKQVLVTPQMLSVVHELMPEITEKLAAVGHARNKVTPAAIMYMAFYEGLEALRRLHGLDAQRVLSRRPR